MKLYDGEDVEGYKRKDVQELRSEHPDEGMSGVDPRYVINRISSALVTSETRCINALDVLRALKRRSRPAPLHQQRGERSGC